MVSLPWRLITLSQKAQLAMMLVTLTWVMEQATVI